MTTADFLFFLWIEFVKAAFIMFPAYATNTFPPLARGKRPLDFGKFLGKGRILGDGKTIEGTFLGLLIGFYVGITEAIAYPNLNAIAVSLGGELPRMTIFLGFLIPIAAMTGDIVGSFIKRRLGIPRGGKDRFIDRLGFVIFTIAFAYWFTEITFTMIFFMLVFTPILHRSANIYGNKIKLKKVPW